MDYNTINQLLEKYFQGNTTLAEETKLKAYFQQAEIAPELEPYRKLFQYFNYAEKQTVSEAFSEQLSTIAASAKPTSPRSRRTMGYRLAIAAAVLLAVATWYLAPTTVPDVGQTAAIDWSKYEPKDEDEALRITTAAFRKTSSSLRKGMQMATGELESVKKLVQPW